MSLLSASSFVTLNNGIKMPMIGLGTYLMSLSNVKQTLQFAYASGYRHIDTAEFYKNEEAIGSALRQLPYDRSDFFITTKIWHSHHGYHNAKKAAQERLDLLQLDYIDLLLIHYPDAGYSDPKQNANARAETWKAMEEFLEEGKAKAIGVSNYTINHLSSLLQHCKYIPSVNQVEIHPLLPQVELHQYCKENNIQLVGYSPLGKGKLINSPQIIELAKKYSKTPSQVLLRYQLQRSIVVIPKSDNRERISENIDLYDFNITEEDIKLLNSMDKNWRCCWNPTNIP